MNKIKNFLIKREQSQARLSFAKREKSRLLAKTILTLVALLTMTTGAWAESKPIGLNVEYEAGDEITSTTDVYVYYGDELGTLKKMGVKITSTQPLKIFMIDAHGFELNGDAAVYYLPDGDATGGYAGGISCFGESTGDATVVHVASGSGTLTDPYVFGSGPSGTPVDVAWDKAKKTGTFTMPGGNVTLEPEYYPQAALTAAPTAINDVPATTDGAIVEAGTVANIGETTKAQGTVMYYVSPSALDDAALLALAADQWTADVPTAADLTEGEAHVYYYVRGNDSDNDEENFSDGDIKAANALTVTIAAEPTYAVTFAEGTDPNEWTASPATGVTKGDKVTVTYTGSKKVLGVKAEKKEKAAIVNPVVGQIIGSDGKNYDANATLPTGVTAVAKIFYVGSETGEAAPYNHGLALALSDANGGSGCKWNTDDTDAGHTKQGSSTFTEESGLQYNDATHNSDTYPAFKAAIANNGTAAPTGCSAWFLASGYQWQKMIDAVGLANLGLTEYAYYWSSSENDRDHAWDFEYTQGGVWSNSTKDYDDLVRACLAF